jgi:hypothetical protein
MTGSVTERNKAADIILNSTPITSGQIMTISSDTLTHSP